MTLALSPAPAGLSILWLSRSMMMPFHWGLASCSIASCTFLYACDPFWVPASSLMNACPSAGAPSSSLVAPMAGAIQRTSSSEAPLPSAKPVQPLIHASLARVSRASAKNLMSSIARAIVELPVDVDLGERPDDLVEERLDVGVVAVLVRPGHRVFEELDEALDRGRALNRIVQLLHPRFGRILVVAPHHPERRHRDGRAARGREQEGTEQRSDRSRDSDHGITSPKGT